jgi:hypothetical protein
MTTPRTPPARALLLGFTVLIERLALWLGRRPQPA